MSRKPDYTATLCAQLSMSGVPSFMDEIDFSTELLRRNGPKDRPYWGCFSGGKDSCIIKELARMAGVNVLWHYNVTTIDPPELVRFIKHHHADVIFDKAREPFFQLAARYGFPTRRARWCCEEYKEKRNPPGSVLILGLRAAEGNRRAKIWSEVTTHIRSNCIAVSPILHWSDSQVWQFIRECNLPYCELYDQGFRRLGCVGCPMAGKKGRLMQFERWPHFERAWKRLFQQIWERRTGNLQKDGRIWFGDRFFGSWQEMWDWWLNDKPLPTERCQGLMERLW